MSIKQHEIKTAYDSIKTKVQPISNLSVFEGISAIWKPEISGGRLFISPAACLSLLGTLIPLVCVCVYHYKACIRCHLGSAHQAVKKIYWPLTSLQLLKVNFGYDHVHLCTLKKVELSLSDCIWAERKEKVKWEQRTWNEEHIFSCTAVKGVGERSGSKANTIQRERARMCGVHGARLTKLCSFLWELCSV